MFEIAATVSFIATIRALSKSYKNMPIRNHVKPECVKIIVGDKKITSVITSLEHKTKDFFEHNSGLFSAGIHTAFARIKRDGSHIDIDHINPTEAAFYARISEDPEYKLRTIFDKKVIICIWVTLILMVLAEDEYDDIKFKRPFRSSKIRFSTFNEFLGSLQLYTFADPVQENMPKNEQKKIKYLESDIRDLREELKEERKKIVNLEELRDAVKGFKEEQNTIMSEKESDQRGSLLFKYILFLTPILFMQFLYKTK